MNPRLLPAFALSLLALHGAASAQLLRVAEAVPAGGTLQTRLVGPAGRSYVTLIDDASGPVRAFGGELFLSLTATTTVLDLGVLPPNGQVRSYRVPGGFGHFVGAFYFQSAIDTPAAPNGMFLISNAESTVVYPQSANALSDRFDDPARSGFAGNYDPTTAGRLTAGRVTSRIAQVQPGPNAFNQPIAGELNVSGVRMQKVYRAIDLGATGEPEVLVGMSWEVFGTVQRDTYPQMILDVSHSDVIPDYSIDPQSAFPKYPNSGLDAQFAANPSSPPVRLFDGPYVIDPANASGGFMPYPRPTRDFVYDGKSSILLDFKTPPSPVTRGLNGQQVYLMVTSSSKPDSRAFVTNTNNPSGETRATEGDNTITGMRFEFVKLFSQAISPWRAAPTARPDYERPILAAATPPGTRISIEFRGAIDAQGTRATAWVKDINFLDGIPFIQYRVLFQAAANGARPSIDSLAIPVR